MEFSSSELAVILAGLFVYFGWVVGGEGKEVVDVDEDRKRREKRRGALSDGRNLRAKELELVHRSVPLPERKETDPALYDADLDLLLKQTENSTAVMRPLNGNRFEPRELSNARTAGKVLMDITYFTRRRTNLRGPDQISE